MTDSGKRQTHPLVIESGPSPKGEESNCQIVTNIWSWATDGARHQDRQTDWPSVAMWLWLWLCWQISDALFSTRRTSGCCLGTYKVRRMFCPPPWHGFLTYAPCPTFLTMISFCLFMLQGLGRGRRCYIWGSYDWFIAWFWVWSAAHSRIEKVKYLEASMNARVTFLVWCHICDNNGNIGNGAMFYFLASFLIFLFRTWWSKR
jgi:hypothetical protein